MKLLTLLLASVGAGLWLGREASPEDPKRQEAFALEKLVARSKKEGGPWLEFLDRPSLSCGLYRLAAGATDGQAPHALDEVYYVVEGRGTLEAGGERLPAEPGAILFVERAVEHRFVEIEEDLTVLVFFSKHDSKHGE